MNLLILGEMIYLILFMSDKFSTCSALCAQPYDEKAAIVLLILSICHLLPAQMNIVSFYFIPRRFEVAIYGNVVDDIKLSDTHDTPLLLRYESEFGQIDDDVNWQVRNAEK